MAMTMIKQSALHRVMNVERKERKARVCRQVSCLYVCLEWRYAEEKTTFHFVYLLCYLSPEQ